MTPWQPLPAEEQGAQPSAPLNNRANESRCQQVRSSPAGAGRTPAPGIREEKPVSLTLLHHRLPGCAVGFWGCGGGRAAPQGEEEEEEERGWGRIAGGSRGAARREDEPRSVGAEPRRGSSAAAEPRSTPQPLIKAPPVPPLPLTQS